MKYISENKLRSAASECGKIHPAIEEFLLGISGELGEELDELTVTKLRPMSEAPIREDILTKIKDTDRLIESFCDDGLCYIHNNYFILDQCEGWIPMPQYKPEE